MTKDLPIDAHEKEIIDGVKENQVVVIVGETGSGKTSRIGVFLQRAGFTGSGRIGITQPRRIAAISVARYVAANLGVNLGEEVGYKIRFDDATYEGTEIKFMTDGVFLREAQNDPDLKAYSVVVIDEAHERSLNIDFALGILKDALTRRKDLKAVITSATIDAQKFSDYFWGAPVISVSGRMHPVEIHWAEESYQHGDDLFDAIVDKVHSLAALPYQNDDIIVFMTGDDVSVISKKLSDVIDMSRAVILPLYGTMQPDEQQKAFARYPGKRKIIVSTNIAETSVTIDGLRSEVDSGYIKQSGYDSETGIGSLDVVKHSQAGCDQRAGRVGRTGPGECYRMYTKEDYDSRPLFTEPEIRRIDLAGVVLQMRVMGIKEVEKFDFIDPPDAQAFHDAHETLRSLGALDESDSLTELGLTMSALPLAPRISRMLIAARERKCVVEVGTIAASLSQRSAFVRPKEKELDADNAHSQFRNEKSDFATFINMWKAYLANRCDRGWCVKNFLNWRVLEEVGNIQEQIFDILVREGFPLSHDEASPEEITKAVATGLGQQICEKYGRAFKRGDVSGIYVHPSSAIFRTVVKNPPKFIVAAEIVSTTKNYARMCAVIEPLWLLEIVPQRCRLEEIELVAWSRLRQVATVREVMFLDGGKEVMTRDREIQLEEARAIQEKLVAEAHSRGLQKFLINKLPYDHTRWIAYEADRSRTAQVNAWVRSPEEGEYYCKVREVKGKYSWETPMVEVVPMFRYVALPGPDGKFKEPSMTRVIRVKTEEKPPVRSDPPRFDPLPPRFAPKTKRPFKRFRRS